MSPTKEALAAELPDFNTCRPGAVLDWAAARAGAKVIWEDTLVDARGNPRPAGSLSHWVFTWQFGFIGLMAFRSPDDEAAARRAAALFVYLWLKGVPCDLASDLAELHGLHFQN